MDGFLGVHDPNLTQNSAPSVHDFAAEASWELQAATLGVERYRRAAEAADPAVLPAAQRLIRETVGPLKDAFEANRRFVARANKKACQSEALRWLGAGDSLLQAAGCMSIVAASVVSVSGSSGKGIAVTKLAKGLSSFLSICRENALWIEEETDRDEKGRKVRSELLQEFMKLHPEPLAEDWRAFRKKHDICVEEFPNALAVQIGSAVISWLAEGAPQWFRLDDVWQDGKSIKTLFLTDKASEILSDVTARAEVAHPMLFPMVVPPNDWRYDERGELEGGYSLLRVDASQRNRCSLQEAGRMVSRNQQSRRMGGVGVIRLQGSRKRRAPKDDDEIRCLSHGVVTTWGQLDALQRLAVEEGIDAADDLPCLLARSSKRRGMMPDTICEGDTSLTQQGIMVTLSGNL